MQSSTVFVRGQWFEMQVSECLTWVVFRDSDGFEIAFYNDEEGYKDMVAWMAE